MRKIILIAALALGGCATTQHITNTLPARPAMVHHHFVQRAKERAIIVKAKPVTTFKQRWHAIETLLHIH